MTTAHEALAAIKAALDPIPDREALERIIDDAALSAIVEHVERLEAALVRLRDCDWVITLPDRMDAVRKIARDALEPTK